MLNPKPRTSPQSSSKLDATITSIGNNLGESHWSLANIMTFAKSAVDIDELTIFQSDTVSPNDQLGIMKKMRTVASFNFG